MKTNNHNKQIEAIILAGGRDFGRCALASHFPTALWPVLGKPVLGRLLEHLSEQGVEHATICSNGDASVLQESIGDTKSIKVNYLNESLPLGTAGCIREACNSDEKGLLLVLQAGIVSLPNIDELVRLHKKGKAVMTVVFEPKPKDDDLNTPVSEIYICEPEVVEFISKQGYCDIKEGLIPAMIRAGKDIYSAELTNSVNNFRDRTGYLHTIANYLANNNVTVDFPYRKYNGSKSIIIANSAEIDPTAKIYGPAVIMENAKIAGETVIFGPAVIGQNVTIGENTLIENGVLWDNCHIGKNCEINSCIIDYNAVIPHNKIVENQAVIQRQKPIIEVLKNKINQLCAITKPLTKKINTILPEWSKPSQSRIYGLQGLAGLILLCLFIWSYWPEFTNLWKIWLRSDEYSSGLLVPFIVVYILWSRRHKIAKCSIQPSVWGLFAFIAAQGFRVLGTFYMYGSAERLSIIISLASLTLLLFGWKVLKKVSTVLLFLCLMLPLPRSVHAAIMLPLQQFATTSAVFCLEMLGYAVIREGNIINLNGTSVAVAEACNGLRMITAFFVIIGLVVMLVERQWWEKIIVMASSLPIAILCNTLRLTVTAIAFTMLTGKDMEKFFHDFGGYLMMPLAIGLVILELWLLMKLTTVPEEKQQQIIISKSTSQIN